MGTDMAKTYRNRITVRAVEYTGRNVDELKELVPNGSFVCGLPEDTRTFLAFSNTQFFINVGDFVTVSDASRHVNVLQPNVFAAMYEEVGA